MEDTSHLEALRTRLEHEKEYLSKEKSETGKQLRRVWIAQIKKEIEAEKAFIGIEEEEKEGITPEQAADLLAELGL